MHAMIYMRCSSQLMYLTMTAVTMKVKLRVQDDIDAKTSTASRLLTIMGTVGHPRLMTSFLSSFYRFFRFQVYALMLLAFDIDQGVGGLRKSADQSFSLISPESPLNQKTSLPQ